MRSYGYCHDDPVDCTDPSGLYGICIGPINWGDCSNNPSALQVASVAIGVAEVGASVALAAVSVAPDFLGPEMLPLTALGEGAAYQLAVAGAVRVAAAGASLYAAQQGTRALSSAGGGGGGGGGEGAGTPRQLSLFDAPPSAPPASDSTSISQQVDALSTDLSEMAASIRMTAENFAERDLSVVEYRASDGSPQYDYAFSRPGVHAEAAVAEQLQAAGIRGEDVTRLYTELEPCGPAVVNCRGNVPIWFPKAKVTWSFRYPDARMDRETSYWKAYIRSLR